jgi:hypothetical protein
VYNYEKQPNKPIVQKSQNHVTQVQTAEKVCHRDPQSGSKPAFFLARHSRFRNPPLYRFSSTPNISSDLYYHAYTSKIFLIVFRDLFRHPFFNFFFHSFLHAEDSFSQKPKKLAFATNAIFSRFPNKNPEIPTFAFFSFWNVSKIPAARGQSGFNPPGCRF